MAEFPRTRAHGGTVEAQDGVLDPTQPKSMDGVLDLNLSPAELRGMDGDLNLSPAEPRGMDGVLDLNLSPAEQRHGWQSQLESCTAERHGWCT
jgi:hypothetical protein